MKLFPLLLAAAVSAASAQAPAADGPAAATPETTLRYIHSSWDVLTRSMSDCDSLVDPKVRTLPVLYLPYGFDEPAPVTAAEHKCHIRVLHLPRPIAKIGGLQPQDLEAEGLLYLPNPYVVPGGRFNEMYGWDSYFILLGLEADHHYRLAKGIVDNFLFEIENYGGVLNANRTYYLTRSQPPFLTSMIRAVLENPRSFPDTVAGRTEENQWLERAYALAEKDYSTWTRPEHLAGNTRLSRYWDYGSGPVPEMADASHYYPDIIRSLLEHPSPAAAGFLVKGSQYPGAAETERLTRTSCDVRASVVCMRAWYGGYRLSKSFYQGDRAMRESGFDTSDRFGPFSGATQDFAPVGLNCLLYRYERDLEHFAYLLGKGREAQLWDRRAQARNYAIHRYLWRAKDAVFTDWDFVHARPSSYAYITWLYPLWAGVASRQEAKSIEAKLDLFEKPGGLATSTHDTGLQWDAPYGWAPTNWIAVAGLDAAGYRDDAARIAAHWDATVDRAFARTGTIREKYNVVARNANVDVTTGYKQNVIGFGWTNGVYLKMRQIVQEEAARARIEHEMEAPQTAAQR